MAFQDELLAIMDEFGVASVASFKRLPPKEKHYFLSRLYKCFDDGLVNLTKELDSVRGLKLHYSYDSRFSDQRMEDTFYKKLAFFTSRSVISCPIEGVSADVKPARGKRIDKRERLDSATLRDLRTEGKYVFGDVKALHRNRGGEIYVQGPAYIVERAALVELVQHITQLREAIQHRLVYLLPALPDRQEQLRTALRKGKVIRGNFRREELVRQFTERDLVKGGLRRIDMGLTRIYLPHLVNVPIERIIELREKPCGAYAEFQRAIETFLTESTHASTESSLLDLLRQVDESVRAIRSVVYSAEKSWRSQCVYLTIQFIALGFVALLPEAVAAAVAPFMGTITAFDYLRSNREYREKRNAPQNDQFFVAWELDRLGR